MFATAALLTKRPVYGMGGNGRVKIGEDFDVKVGVMRSWQHKASRRSSTRNMTELATCMGLQVAAGFYTAPSDYVGTILCEDIGLAGVGHIVRVQQLRTQARDLTKKLPIGAERMEKLLTVHAELAHIVARCERSRLVPEMAAITLITMPKLADYVPEARQLPTRIDACRAVARLSHTGTEIRAAIRSVTAAIIARVDVWDLIGHTNSPIIGALKRMATSPGASEMLCVHLAVWIVCMRQETFPQRLESVIQWTPALMQPAPWAVPAYAYDKHTGHVADGGYAQFYAEGMKCDDDKRAWIEDDNLLRSEAFRVRMQYEANHGPGSSKGRRILASLRAGAAGNAERKEPAPPSRKRKPKAVPAVPRAAPDTPAAAAVPPNKRQRAVLPFPILQQITGTSKKMVYLDGETILKGPYRRDEPKFVRNFDAHRRISAIDYARGAPCSVLKAPEVVERKEGIFLKWPRVGPRSVGPITTALVVNSVMEPTNVVVRGAVSTRVSELTRAQLDTPTLEGTLNHFYARTLAGVGDTGPFNVLVKEDGGVCGIDLEEVRANYYLESDDPLLVLVGRRIANADLYRAKLHTIKRLNEADVIRLLSPDGVAVWRRLETLLTPHAPPPLE